MDGDKTVATTLPLRRRTDTGGAEFQPIDTSGDPLAALLFNPQALAVLDVDKIERLIGLRERAKADEARREYHEAFADFQANCPVVRKLRQAKFESTRTGAKVSYNYADASDVVGELGPELYPRGFSYSFDTEVPPDGRMCKAICRMRHKGGHSETSSVTVPTESSSAMSPQQKIAAARSFAKRLAFLDVLGLFTADPVAEAVTVGMEKISEEQAANLRALVDETKAASAIKTILEIAGVASIEDVPANRYNTIVSALEKRRAKGGAA